MILARIDAATVCQSNKFDFGDETLLNQLFRTGLKDSIIDLICCMPVLTPADCMFSILFTVMRQRFIVCCGLASCTLLAPTLWYLWIYSGSANANFYFAISLVFNTGQVIFIYFYFLLCVL